MRTARRSLASIGAILAVALLAASCGDDGDGGASPTTAAPATTAAGDGGTTTAPPTAETTAPTTAPATTAPVEEANVRFFRSIPFDAGGAFWYLAQDKGYFDEEKIVGEVSTGQGAATAVAAVVAGEAEIGQVSIDTYLNALAQGGDLVAFWQFIPSGVFGMAWDGSKVSGPEDLAGKRVGVIGPTSATFFSAKLILSTNGVDPSQVEFINLGAQTPQAYAALRDGTIDALGTWDAQITAIRQAAEDEGRTEFLENLVYEPSNDYQGDVLITKKSFFDENQDIVVRFTRAMVRGIEAMGEDPEEAMRVTEAGNPAIRADDVAQQKILQLRIDTLLTDGTFDHDEIERVLDLYYENEIITSDPSQLDVPTLFPNDVADEVKNR
jgi:NitT/TauT family transport system substrate-binding protein